MSLIGIKHGKRANGKSRVSIQPRTSGGDYFLLRVANFFFMEYECGKIFFTFSLYNHIKTASELRQGCDYSMFKQGIRPMWEDDQNKCGGRWLINLEKKQRSTDLDNFWLEILLCMIGEAFNEYSDDVCGAVVNVRTKGDKIGIWTSNANSEDSVMEIG